MRRRRGGVAKWLALCFPYGLYLMWGRRCRWHVAVKCLVTAAFAAAVAALVAAPMPSRTAGTSINLVGQEPVAEIYGPDAPEGYDAALYMPGDTGEDLLASVEEDDTVYVYASANEGSTYYHTSVCKFAYASSKRMTLYEAYILGYTTPCELCKPPVYNPGGAD